jgi:thioester reductase-like protein
VLSGHTIERGYLVIGPIYVAEDCSVGMLSVIMPHTSLDHNVALAPMSMVPLGTALPPMTTWHGSPVRKKEGSLLAPQQYGNKLRGGNPFSFKYTAMLASAVQNHPGRVQSALASGATRIIGGLVGGILSWLALMPAAVGVLFLWYQVTAVLVLVLAFGFVLSFPLYMILVVALKWLVLGRTRPGKYKAGSSYAVRYELVNLWLDGPLARSFCRNFSKTPLMPLTLRALGAKVGKKAIFYKIHPLMLAGADQLSFGDNVVIGSDALVLGGAVLADTLLIAPTIANTSAFVADGALVLPGSTLGITALVGVQTIIPPFSELENGSVWAGSPALCLDPGIVSSKSKFEGSKSMRPSGSGGSVGSKATRWQRSQRLLAVHTLDHAMSSRNMSYRKSSLLSRGFSGLNAIGEDEVVTDKDFLTKQTSAAAISKRFTLSNLSMSPFDAPKSPTVGGAKSAELSPSSLWEISTPLFSQASTIVEQLQEMQEGGIFAYFTLLAPCLLLTCYLFGALIGPAYIIGLAGVSSRTLAFCLVPVAAVVFCIASALLLLLFKHILLRRTERGKHSLYGKWAFIRSAALSSLFDISGPAFLNALMGSPWAGWYLRALGATIGKDVYLDGLPLVETDLLTLGDGVIVNRGAKINVHNVENGTVECHEVDIAPEVTLGPRAYVMPTAALEERSALGALSVVMNGESVDEGVYAEGYPLTHLGTWYDSEAPQPAAATDAAAVVEEMRRDAMLPSDIRPAPVQAPAGAATPFQTVKPGPPEVVLLTGATGFVGGFILRELLRPRRGLKRVYCLVRCKSPEDGTERIHTQLLHHELYTETEWAEIAAPRLHVLPGDLGQASLGLDATTMQVLADEVDVIINNGAMVNVTRGYAGVKTSNVDAVLELLRLSTRGAYAKPVHQISTGGALPRTMTGAIKEEYINPEPDYLANFTGYDQSKWVAERLVLAAGQSGLFTAVQRLGRVGGDSTSGGANESDYCMLLIKGCLQMGCFPLNYQFALNIIPGDVAAKVICDTALAVDGSTCGRTYHVTNPKPPPFQLAVDVLKQLGYQFEEVPYSAWRERLFSCARDDNALRPLELAFGQDAPKKKAYTFDTTNSGIRGNTLSAAHLKRDFEWCEKVGFFPPLPKNNDGDGKTTITILTK